MTNDEFDRCNCQERVQHRPGNKVIAVSFVLNYEEGAEHTPWNGDDQSCDSLHELHYNRPATSGGVRDGLVEDMVRAVIADEIGT